MMKGLNQKIKTILEKEKKGTVKRIWIRLGALLQISEDHFREHFTIFTEMDEAGSYLKGIELVVEQETDILSPGAQEIRLERVEVEFD